jgi:urease accessory protein
VLREVSCQPPLTLRKVQSDERGVCGLCLVGSAAGPLPGDELALSLELAAGARATLRAAGASIAQGRRRTDELAPTGEPPSMARVTIAVSLGEGAELDAEPGALVVCAGAWVELGLRIMLAPGAVLRWREVVVLGRTAEAAGRVRVGWHVDRDGRALLRQDTDLSDPTLAAWPGMIAGARMLTSELRVGPDEPDATIVHSPTHVTQRLAEHATLTTQLEPRPARS